MPQLWLSQQQAERQLCVTVSQGRGYAPSAFALRIHVHSPIHRQTLTQILVATRSGWGPAEVTCASAANDSYTCSSLRHSACLTACWVSALLEGALKGDQAHQQR
jgi:hypothetical protein